MQDSKQPASHDEGDVDLGKLFGVLIDARWLIITITAVFVVVGVCVALLSTPIYRADALIQIEGKSGGMSALTSEMGDLFGGESSAATEIEILKSRMVLGKTVNELRLEITAEPNYFPVVGKGLSRLMGSVPAIKVGQLGLVDQWEQKPFTIEYLGDTQFKLYSPEDSLLATGSVGESLSAHGVTIRIDEIHGEAGDRFTVTRQRRLEVINELRNNLSVSEKGKKSGILSLALVGDNPILIQASLNSIATNFEAQNLQRESAEAEKTLSFLNAQLPSMRGRLDVAENALNEYRQSRESVDLSREAEAMLDVMVKLEAQQSALRIKESEISKRFTESHPTYIALIEQRKTLQEEQEKLEAQMKELPETQREILRLSRDVQVSQEIYLLLLSRNQELEVIKAGTVGYVRVLDNAEVKIRPIKPKKSLIVLTALLLGCVLAVALVLVRESLRRGINGVEGIEAMGLPVYGTIPLSDTQCILNAERNKSVHETLLSLANPADLSIEAIRSLRTSLHFAMMDADNNVVMITGPSPGIGKSFISANLAMVLAYTGQRVLLVDTDMRKGHLDKEMATHNQQGLASYLSGTHSIEQIIQSRVGNENLSFISRGSVPPNPSELLMHQRFQQLMEWANNEFDVVIVDTPPVLAVTDASIVGKHCGVSLMLGRFEITTLKEVEVSRQRFEQAGVRLNGFVLNAVERRALSTYGEGYGYYNYEYQS